MKAVLVAPSGPLVLGTTPLKIGSNLKNELVLNDALAVTTYAEITAMEDGHQVVDVGSPQSIQVNGQVLSPHTPQKLENGDLIVVGKRSFVYKLDRADANDSTLIAERHDGRSAAYFDDRELADQPTDTALLAQPRTQESKSVVATESAGAVVPDQTNEPEIAPNQAPAPLPAYHPQPVLVPGQTAAPVYGGAVGGSAVYSPIQAVPAQAYAASSGANYAAVPGAPTGGFSGTLVQPGYAAAYAPAQFATPVGVPGKTPAAKRRERLFLWGILLIVVVLLLGVSNVGTYAFARATTPKPAVPRPPALPSPQKTLQTFCQGVMSSNAEEIYGLLSDEAKVHTSLDDIQKIFDELKLLSSAGSMSAKYTNCGFDSIRTSNTLAVANVLLSITITFEITAQGQSQSDTTTETVPSLTSMLWEHNQWKIDVSSITQAQPKLG